MSASVSILPTPRLAPYVTGYQLLKFDTGELEVSEALHAFPEMQLLFFLRDEPFSVAVNTTHPVATTHKIWLQGLSISCKTLMRFYGEYLVFIIRFAPIGFYRIFNCPAKLFTNKITEGSGLFGSRMCLLREKLRLAEDIFEMAALCDRFLLTYLGPTWPYPCPDGFTSAIDHILKAECSCKVMNYAKEAHMSLRNFERKFSEQVGTTPKLFCRTLRFHRLLNLKRMGSEKSWAEISFECGYFDQMHLIKDFKKFTNASPEKFFERTTEYQGFAH